MTAAEREAEIRKLLPAQPRYGQRVRFAHLPSTSGFGRTAPQLLIRNVEYDWNGQEWLAELDAPSEWPQRIRP